MIEQLDTLLSVAAGVLLVLVLVPLSMTVRRMLVSPGTADRFIALDMLTSIAVAVGALVAVITRRREFLDVAFGLALFGFVGTTALAAFLGRKGGTT